MLKENQTNDCVIKTRGREHLDDYEDTLLNKTSTVASLSFGHKYFCIWCGYVLGTE